MEAKQVFIITKGDRRMSKTIKQLTNSEQRLICEIKGIAKKISRNQSKGYSIEKLETAFVQKRTMLESKGVKVKDYAMFST